jgi:hypothetical protein
MEHPHEPMDAIEKWQKWYKSNQVVASLETPLVSKDSRENLHDTSNTMTTLSNMPSTNNEWRQAVLNGFADTITEAMSDFSGIEIYKCFLQAAQENLDYCEQQYKNAKELMDCLVNEQ